MNLKWVAYVGAALLLTSSCAFEPPDDGPPEDLNPPFVSSVFPTDGEDSVSVVPTISVTFSEAVEAPGVEYAFSLSNGSAEIEGSCSWSAKTMIFEPERELDEFTTYFVEVLGGFVVDTSGNHMEGTFYSSFTTGLDTNPPHIIGVAPEHQSIDNPRGVRIEVEFSEPMDTTSVEQAFTLSEGVSPLPGTFLWSDNTMYFVPGDKLTDLTTYNVNVITSATDDSSNPVSGEFNSSFTVGMVVDIAVGNRHTLVALSGGTVRAWGYNLYGQLGNSTSSYRNTPVKVSGVSDATAVAAGRNHSVALLSDGTVRAWGSNYAGQLGDGSNIPLTVSGITDAVAVAAGGFHTVALLSDGTVVAWGRNSSGQLGDGTNTDRNTPVAVNGITGAVAIACGGAHTLALLDDGTVKAWGEDHSGQLGDGFNNNNKNTPVLVEEVTGAAAIGEGAAHSAAVLADKKIKAWGSNSHGQIGSGGFSNTYSIPVQVSGINTAVKISSGIYHTVSLLSDGTVKAWGTNSYGELGDGAYDSSNTPVTVSGL